jgi:PKHD-type hydroxylase
MIIKAKYRLSKALIAQVLKLKAVVPAEKAVTYANNAGRDLVDDKSFRSTEIRWLMYEQFAPIHQEMIRAVSEHQPRFGIRDPLRIERGVQLATYHVGDHYGWHIDGRPGDGTRRVLSISVLLTDDFKGGRLDFRTPGAPPLKKAGDIVIFNSDEWHRVAPVTAGVRESLVVWFTMT